MNEARLIITLGPSTLNEEFLSQVDDLDVSLLRINMSHSSIKDLKEAISLIKKYSSLPICIDSEGAQLRCTQVRDDKVFFTKGTVVSIIPPSHDFVGSERSIAFTPSDVSSQFRAGDLISIDFDGAKLRVIDSPSSGESGDCIKAIVETAGFVKSNRAANLNRPLDLDPITTKDREAFKVGSKLGIKHYALSFASSKKDVETVLDFIPNDSTLISKIESIDALQNLDEILSVTDEILIDRGDLSRQVPIESIPFLQKLIIERARYCKVPVLVATNLLETMIEKSQPTRAEMNDIVSTLATGANGLVLAAETAIGNYPIRTIKIITTIRDYFNKWNVGVKISDILNSLS